MNPAQMKAAQADFRDNIGTVERTLTQIIDDMKNAFRTHGWQATLEPADRQIANTEVTWRVQGSIVDIDQTSRPITLGFNLTLRRANSETWDLETIGMAGAYVNQLPRGWRYDKPLFMDQAGTARDLVNFILQSWETDIRQTGS